MEAWKHLNGGGLFHDIPQVFYTKPKGTRVSTQPYIHSSLSLSYSLNQALQLQCHRC